MVELDGTETSQDEIEQKILSKVLGGSLRIPFAVRELSLSFVALWLWDCYFIQ